MKFAGSSGNFVLREPTWLLAGNIYRVGPKELAKASFLIHNETMKRIFIGVAWPYVNGDIHIGHLAGYLLPADIFARFHRFLGNDVLMVSGSDCYGTPIALEADKRNVPPEDIVNEYHPKNVLLFKKANISFDIYTKTTTENHKKIVQDIFLKLLKNGYLKREWTKQYYSEKEKRFLPDRYVEGICPNCENQNARSDQCDQCSTLFNQGELKEPKNKLTGSPLIEKETEHYFFDWPKLEPFLKKYVREKGGRWKTWIRKETEGWLKRGLKPRAITRDLDWGIELPVAEIPEDQRIDNIKNKRIYVWFEAVIGYLSAATEWADTKRKPDAPTLKDFWYNGRAEHFYFMGKDNLVFHTLFWPGELRAYDKNLHLPDVLSINQFLNLEGYKFSKSRGIIIDSAYIIDTYGADPVRFYLATIMPEMTDADWSWTEFVHKHNHVLIGNLGNFINRTLTLAKNSKLRGRFVEGKVIKETTEKIKEAKEALENAEFKKYANAILELSDLGNKYLGNAEPWKDTDHDVTGSFHKVMSSCVYMTLALQALIKPLLPETYEKLEHLTGIQLETWPKNGELKNMVDKVKIGTVVPLFQKIEPTAIEEELSKLPIHHQKT